MYMEERTHGHPHVALIGNLCLPNLIQNISFSLPWLAVYSHHYVLQLCTHMSTFPLFSKPLKGKNSALHPSITPKPEQCHTSGS